MTTIDLLFTETFFILFMIGAVVAFAVGSMLQGFVVHHFIGLVRWWEWAIWTVVTGVLIGPNVSFFVMAAILGPTRDAPAPWDDIFLVAASAIGVAFGTLVASLGQAHLLFHNYWRNMWVEPFFYYLRWALPVALSWMVGIAVALAIIMPNRGVANTEMDTFFPEPSMSYVFADAIGALVATLIAALLTGAALVRLMKRFEDDISVGKVAHTQ